MSLLFRIVRAAHATGTHHKLAIDALPQLAASGADAWQTVFLVESARLLEGAKAPDTTFKDFTNHVLHPRDGFWGGAPEKVAEWYETLVAALVAGDWPQAAFSAGVLSHYLSDPFMPLHTGQSDAESAYHRAIEWSVSRSYDRLMADAERRAVADTALPDIAAGRRGLKDLVCRAAERSNASYEALLAHYDLATGVVDPPSGLDAAARTMVGDMLLAARRAIAAVMSRAIAEAGVAAPHVALAGATMRAVLAVPRNLLAKRLSDAGDRALVLAQYDELLATGHVELTLDEDQRAVRDAWQTEVQGPRAAAQDAARARRLDSEGGGQIGVGVPATVGGLASPSLRERLEQSVGGEPLARLIPRPAATGDAQVATVHLPTKAAPAAPTPLAAPLPTPATARVATADPRPDAGALAAAVAASGAATAVRHSAASRPPAPPRIHLASTDPLEAAPAIGPKTAERLAAAGLHTVADLLAADPEIVAQTGVARVDATTLRDWQDQARLVLTVPGLRGGGAQLLVGAGYRSLRAIADAEPDTLCADVLSFATTSAGQRILRDGRPLDITKVKAWADAAREVAQAA